MPITAPVANDTPAFDAVSRGILDAGANLAFKRGDRPAAASRELSLALPHRIAQLSLEQIYSRAKLRDATEMSHWRYLVLEERPGVSDPGTFAAIAAAVAVPADGGYRFSNWTESDLVTGMEAAVRAAEQLPQVRTGDYEPLLLLAPDVQVTALWLRNRQSANSEDSELILPIPNAPSEPYRPMKPREFFELLEAAARIPPSASTA